jgi:basic amino acid/polyamine antiporter, APA family
MVLTSESATAREAPPQGPRFGLATATFVVVSSMIGTGVLTTSGFTVYFVGSNQLMLSLWVLAGCLRCAGP